MAQFITVTVHHGGDVVRLNVEVIGHYVRPAGSACTEILLTGGGLLKVNETMTELDDLIRNAGGKAVVSGG